MTARPVRPRLVGCVGGAVTSMLLAACTSMTGIGGASHYACKAPEGVACDSVSGNYANSMSDRLPSSRGGGPQNSSLPPPPVIAETKPVVRTPPTPTQAYSAPTTLRSPARILRLWIKPWEDADGDLVDQSYVYVQIDTGQWLVDHAQRQIRDAYKAVKPPQRPGNTSQTQTGEAGVQRPLSFPTTKPTISGATGPNPNPANAPAGSDID